MQNQALDVCLYLVVDDTFISTLQTGPLQHKPLKKISLPNKKSDKKPLLPHIFIFLRSGNHILSSRVINMNKKRKGIVEELLICRTEICIKVSLI